MGHSLGGHIAGLSARKLHPKISRITLLDAAYPGFYDSGLNVKASDAEFVDAIHTDSGIFGTPYSTGHVDFWPNKGERDQPGCKLTFPPFYPTFFSFDSKFYGLLFRREFIRFVLDFCSHFRSWRYWAESLGNEFAFPATKCSIGTHKQKSGLQGFIEYKMSYHIRTYMGIAADPW